MADNNAGFIQYSDLLDKTWTLKERLDVAGIYVKSRDELIKAQTFIRDTLKRPAIVKFTAPFEVWTAPKTDIDVGFVYIDGNGVNITTNIPNGTENDHNYFLRCYTTTAALDINIPIRPAPILKDFTVRGIGSTVKTSSTETETETKYNYIDGIRFYSPEGPLGNFSVNNVYISGFYYGMYFGTNAYIGHHYACEIIRCFECLHMPQAKKPTNVQPTQTGDENPTAQNFGEGINFFGGTIGNSKGLAIGNQNPNGAFRFFGTSIDYAGTIANVEAGSIEFHGCHIEFSNKTNPVNDIPFRCSANQNASLLIQGGEIIALNGLASQDYCFYAEAGSSGIIVDNVKFYEVRTATGRYFGGTGDFVIKNSRLDGGGGGKGIQTLTTANNNKLKDGNFSFTTKPIGWEVSGGNVSNPFTSDVITLTIESGAGVNGSNALKVTKLGNTNSSAGVRVVVPVSQYEQLGACFNLKTLNGGSGNLFATLSYACIQEVESNGVSIIAKSDVAAWDGTLNASDYAEFKEYRFNANRRKVPVWATHVILSFNLYALAKNGVLYFDNACITAM
ncbi:hypothetical protein JKX24_03560 [Serratia proteamaculans]|uniref:Uncharacterized protein n=1 Tax=Serratia proteamaculans TaxID=28151 RepID=A0A7U0N7V4_SERPR|nr:hypothetical protein [Serratia proteamaculans]MBO1501094.1 hypothetical protein [Serratia proteamaculans]MDW5509846.1 hypothetical protein [Serratia proteamaculans]QQX54116.1 hypothetical protein JKX24_03560 [Serratia proteamaculans]